MIEKFATLKAVAIPLDRGNVDTDAIIPARFLKTIKRTGLGTGLFHAWRFDENGTELPDFVLNMEPYRSGKILVAGENFGCGSSREHAVWALMDFGIRVVIAPSFGDIFYNNGLKNGLLPVRLAPGEVRALMDGLKSDPGGRDLGRPSCPDGDRPGRCGVRVRHRVVPQGVPPAGTRRDRPDFTAGGGDRTVRAQRAEEGALAVPGPLIRWSVSQTISWRVGPRGLETV